MNQRVILFLSVMTGLALLLFSGVSLTGFVVAPIEKFEEPIDISVNAELCCDRCLTGYDLMQSSPLGGQYDENDRCEKINTGEECKRFFNDQDYRISECRIIMQTAQAS